MLRWRSSDAIVATQLADPIARRDDRAMEEGAVRWFSGLDNLPPDHASFAGVRKQSRTFSTLSGYARLRSPHHTGMRMLPDLNASAANHPNHMLPVTYMYPPHPERGSASGASRAIMPIAAASHSVSESSGPAIGQSCTNSQQPLVEPVRVMRRVSFEVPGDVEILPERRSRFALPTPPENRMRLSSGMSSNSEQHSTTRRIISTGNAESASLINLRQSSRKEILLCAINGVDIRQNPSGDDHARTNSEGDTDDEEFVLRLSSRV